MFFTIREFTTNTDDEHSTVFLAYFVLTLLWREVRIHLKEFLAVDEVNLTWEERLNL